MNEIAELLREQAVKVACPIELPDDDDLVVIEEELLIPLPADFKEYLLEVSDVVYGTLEPVTASDPQLHTHLPEVAAQAWNLGLPRDLIPLCEMTGGYYAVTQEGQVLRWQDGVLDEDDGWNSIWDWVKEVWLES